MMLEIKVLFIIFLKKVITIIYIKDMFLICMKPMCSELKYKNNRFKLQELN